MRAQPLLLMLLAGLLVLSCVTEFQPDRVSIPSSLIVEGVISDQPGPYQVKLTRTADYSYSSLNLLETGATLTISDNAGNSEVLKEQASGGVYLTSTTKGVTGRTYKLTIRTKTGEQYESDAELLKAAPPISKVYSEYRYDGTQARNSKANGWDVYIDTKDAETPGDFYRWEWAHYEYTEVCATSQPRNVTYLVGLPCCSACWDITRCYTNDCVNVLSDVAVNGNSISRQFILRVPFDSYKPYYVEVTQSALSQGIYTFFKTVKQQVLNTGGLFDAAPANIGGNMHATGSTTLPVYGYFGAVGQSTGYLLVDRSVAKGAPEPSELPINLNSLAPCVTCQNNQFRTPNKPRWWTM